MSTQSSDEQLVPGNRASEPAPSGRGFLFDLRMVVALVVSVLAVGIALLAAIGIPAAWLLGDGPQSREDVLKTLFLASYMAVGPFAVLSLLSAVFASKTRRLAIASMLLAAFTLVFFWGMFSYFMWSVGIGGASDQEFLRMFLMLYPPVVLWSVLAGAASARYTTRRLRRWTSGRGRVCRTSASTRRAEGLG